MRRGGERGAGSRGRDGIQWRSAFAGRSTVIRLVPADALDRRELAELFTAGYEGYFVPLQVDEATLDFMVGRGTSTSPARGSRSATASRSGSGCSRCAATRRGSADSASFRRLGVAVWGVS
jgi:Tfp pilus assembly PilM family ATPase